MLRQLQACSSCTTRHCVTKPSFNLLFQVLKHLKWLSSVHLSNQVVLFNYMLLVFLCFTHLVQPTEAQLNFSSINNAKFPSLGDLLIGRVNKLHATSTCGQFGTDTYCPIGAQKCKSCNSVESWHHVKNTESHQIENIVAKIRNSNTTYDSWWMSEPGKENVSISLELESKFTFTHLIMIFHSYRPKAWWLERSSNYGMDWKPYGYFAENCATTFPGVDTTPRKQLDDVRCSSDYTDMAPSDKGQVVFNVIPQHISETEIFNDKSVINKERREAQTDITNLRVHFTQYHTLSDEKLGEGTTERKKYYYGLYEMNVHGMCICNGHAQTCKPADEMGLVDKNAVYGFCECMHNTKGGNCEECQDFYHDRKWGPANLTNPNQCRRCNCHGHSNKCAFSEKKWAETGGKSGGVCLTCLHDTMGDNCEECKSGFYRDETKLLEDPDICLPCRCSISGSRFDSCNKASNKAEGEIAGHCICKTYVTGKNCDKCLAGYWNMQMNNSVGCQKCKCEVVGTRDNMGCDQFTGVCPCKKNVEGDYCNKCKTGFFNLSTSLDGCSPCNCDFGGSLNNECEAVSGQCPCKEGFSGRRCSVIKDGYFVPRYDIQVQVLKVTEVDDAKKFDKNKGRVLLPPDGSFEIPLRNQTKGLPHGDYDIHLKYWASELPPKLTVTVTLEPGIEFKECGFRPPTMEQMILTSSTRPDEFQVTAAFKKICIDKEGLDKMRIDFKNLPPRSNVSLDSVIIGKGLDKPVKTLADAIRPAGRAPPVIFADVGYTNYEFYMCIDYLKSTIQLAQMPKVCGNIVISLTGRSVPKAEPCSCVMTGSKSTVCEKVGGQCSCRNNIEGRPCDKCIPNYYGFGQESGCLPCACNMEGSRSTQCDLRTGQCNCSQLSIIGRPCDQCQVGFFLFPVCQQCQCNNLATDCNKISGVCLDCQQFTGGNSCEVCKTGYFGDPTRNVACERCKCPRLEVQHADTCQLKSLNPKTSKCNCQPGYLGDNCDKCAINHFGDPQIGKCIPCMCNNNIDLTVPESCHPFSGGCTRCLNNTKGFACEECKDGFHGDATKGQCNPCVCNENGTNSNTLLPNPIAYQSAVITYKCDPKTSQCKCLPNVEGSKCDRCATNHYNLTSKSGCTHCQCDPIGSFTPQCDVVTGQCTCKEGRGGRRCDQCEDLYFGDPTKSDDRGCTKCNCNPQGSQLSRCNKITGQCECKTAITGRQCDQCERGTTGVLPNCSTCGECWYNWDKLIAGLTNQTQKLSSRASDIAKSGGLGGNFGEDIKKINLLLNTVWKGINESKVPADRLKQIQDNVNALQKMVEEFKPKFESETERLMSDMNRINSINMTYLRETMERLVRAQEAASNVLQGYKNQMNQPSLSSPQSKLDSINQFEQQFNKTADSIRQINATFNRVMFIHSNSLRSMAMFREKGEAVRKELIKTTNDMNKRYLNLEANMPNFTKALCVGSANDRTFYDRKNQFCSAVCGGPPNICNSGSVECGEGSACSESILAKMSAVKKKFTELEKKIATTKDTTAKHEQEMKQLKLNSNNLNLNVLTSEKNAKKLLTQFDELREEAQYLIKQMTDFVAKNKTTKKHVDEAMNKIRALTISTSDAEMAKLSGQINTTLANVIKSGDMGKIGAETQEARQNVTLLMNQAKEVAAKAKKLLNEASALRASLNNATEKQSGIDREVKEIEAIFKEVSNLNSKLRGNVEILEQEAAKASNKAKLIEDNINEAQKTKFMLNAKIEGLNNEQNKTKELLDAAAQTLDQATTSAAQNGISIRRTEVDKRQQVVNDLMDKVNKMYQKLGGGDKLLDNSELKINNLLTRLQDSFAKLRKLTLVLDSGVDTPGSVAYFNRKIDNQVCNRVH